MHSVSLVWHDIKSLLSIFPAGMSQPLNRIYFSQSSLYPAAIGCMETFTSVIVCY